MRPFRFSILITIVPIAAACGDDAASSDGDGTGAATGPGATTTAAAGPGATSSSSGAGGEAEGGGGGGGAPPTGTAVLVAVGYGGRRTSSLDGVTWENDVIVDPNGGDDDNLFRGVGFGNDTFVAVGGAAVGQIATSTDGATWTFQAPVSSWLGDVAYQNGVFVTAGGNGLRLRSTDGGVTWTDDAGYYAGHFRGIAAGNGVFVAAGHTYGGGDVGLISTTTDGVTWTPEQTGGGTFGSIAFGAGVFVAVGNDRCSVSSDGASWSDCSIAASDFGRVVYGAGVFAMRAGDGIYTSADGATWAPLASQSPPQGLLGQGVGMWIGGNWPDDLFASADLASWDNVFGGTGPAFVDVQVGYVQ
ncbi:MAG: hypothetical protein HOV80_07070 [Polyangiaceae bacterium]|nr:hypothetical protein [Polyangiaceae bacterium]